MNSADKLDILGDRLNSVAVKADIYENYALVVVAG
jgi:hypothetical protein